MKSSDHFVIFLFTFPFAFESNQDYPTLRFGWTLGEGFTKKSSDRYAIFLFSFPFVYESEQDYPSLRFGWTLGEGFTKKSSDRYAIFLFSFPFVYESKLSTLLKTKKASRIRLAFLSSGKRSNL